MKERDKNGHLKAGIRLPGWDYCKPWIYMITLVVRQRRSILGVVKDGLMHNSLLGDEVAKAWKNLAQVFPEVEPCQYAVMPEHFHGIIWVHQKLNSPLGEVIRSFKIACTKANASLVEADTVPAYVPGLSASGQAASSPSSLFEGSPTFWFPGLYDTILFSKGQLKRMTRYTLRNAERRWAVMQNPDLFKVTRGINLRELIANALDIGDSSNHLPAVSQAIPEICDAIGNHFLIDSPNKLLIQVSRRATPAEINSLTDKALLHGNRGGVSVSGCISPGEQAVAKAIREAGLPLIAIIPRGFGPYFKPNGAYFDACVAGKLLMLSPFPQIGKTEPLTRQRCFDINAVAAALCGDNPNGISYRGSQPGHLR